MPKKRVSITIDDKLHSQLKAEASAQGIPLGSYCEAILEGRGNTPSPPVKEVDASTIAVMPLDELRALNSELVSIKPAGWERSTRLVNSEIRRRYRV